MNRLNIGGVSIIVLNLCQPKHDSFEVKLLTGEAELNEGDASFIAKEKGITPLIMPEMKRSIHLKNDWKAYQKIRAIIRDFQPHIVHTHAAKPGALGRLAASHEQVPAIIHTFHGHVFEGYFGKLKSQFYINIERFLAQKTTKIIAISNSQKNDLSTKYKIAPSSKFEVIENGFDLNPFQTNTNTKRDNFRKHWGIVENEVVIGIIGRLVPIKNISFFIDTIKLLNQLTKNSFKVLIIGDGEEIRLLKDKVDLLELSNIITFTSWINPIDTAYAGIDILALSSINEGTPTTLIEAQAAAVPIVSTNVGGVSDIVLPEETAFLVESNNVIEFSNKLKKLIESETLRLKMGEAGQVFANQNFTVQRMLDRTYDLYEKLLA